MPSLCRVLVALLFLTAGLPQAWASGAVAVTDHVRAELVASAEAVRPGETILVGLNQQIIPHWHTYWLNPGDSGLATSIAWQLPEGAAAGEILWPRPKRIPVGPIANYGYEDEVTLLTEVAVPEGLQPGESFPMRATVDWLVCEEICIPEQVELSLTLPVAAPGAPVGPGSPLIEQARAELPVESPWPAAFAPGEGTLTLTLAAPELSGERLEEAYFFPAAWGAVEHAAPQPWEVADGRLLLRLKPGAAAQAAPDGVLVLTERTPDGPLARAFTIQGQSAQGGTAGITPLPSASESEIGLGLALLFALAGGLILNLMPCVFPVLSMKALSLISHAREAPRQVRLHGAAYTLGVLVSFALLAGLLVALKAGGAAIGWGFQFQSPLFVLLVAYVIFAVGLSQSGVFTIGERAAGIGAGLADRRGYAGSFFTGVLATIVATPCTAPFMGAAIGFALAQPTPQLFAIFLALGLGLALPYLLLSLWPPLLRLLPRPGPWMLRFKQVMAFPLYGAAAWLVWVLAQQSGADGVAAALGGMVLIAFAAWLYDSTRQSRSFGRHAGGLSAAVALVLAVALGVAATERATAGAPATAQAEGWEPYSAERLETLRTEGKAVFLNFTAAWCITCLVNERVALNQPEIRTAFEAAGITYLKGDWTNQDPAITAKLAEFGRSGVPLYVFYPAGSEAAPLVLPQILTVEGLRQALALPGAAASASNL